MNAWLFATLLCLCPNDDTIARAGSFEVGRAQFADWLVDRVGYSHAEEFLLEQLILAAAEEQGLRPSAGELETAYQAERNKIIEDTFRGDAAAYRNDLISRGQSPEAHDARRRSQLEPEICLERMARQLRVVTDEMLRDRYQTIFGELGERVSVEVLFFSLYHGIGPDSPRPDLNAQAVLAESRARDGAAALRAGRPLADLLPSSDPITNEFVRDGFVDLWRKNLLGSESELGLASLDNAGEVSPPIRVWDGYLVLRLVERRAVTFEQARDELTALVAQDKPTAEELGVARSAIRDRNQVEILLR